MNRATTAPPLLAWRGQTDPNGTFDETVSLYDLLYDTDFASAEFGSKLESMETAHGTQVYARLIHVLAHLEFSEGDAKRHWQSILAHREFMQDRLGTAVDFRVAMTSYFLQVRRKLRRPKIIELRAFEQTQASVYRDELTGLYNYRFFSEFLARETARSDRESTPLSLVMLDVDSFKLYNDANGHSAGNTALAAVAGILARWVRPTDVVARYGGEEFAIVFPDTAKLGAGVAADRLRDEIQNHVFANADCLPEGRLTVSLGVATYPGDAPDSTVLVQRADQALYSAKSDGRNRVRLFGESTRSYRRVSAELEGEFGIVAPAAHRLTAKQVSEGGLLFSTKCRPKIGALVEIRLRLPDSAEAVPAAGRVIHTCTKPNGEYDVAVRIVEIPTVARNRLTKFLRGAPAGASIPENSNSTPPVK